MNNSELKAYIANGYCFYKAAKCYGPQKLDKEIITLFVNEFGTVTGSFRSE